MFIAHLPASYLLTSKLREKFKLRSPVFWGLLGGIFPDFDMFYFYLIDQRRHAHHEYWTHIPFYYLLGALLLALLQYYRPVWRMAAAWIFLGNVFLHLILDSFVGYIYWLAPFYWKSFALFHIEAQYSWWVYNFILHWTFLVEVLIVGWAVVFYFQRRFRTLGPL